MATKKKATGTLWHIRAEGLGECRVAADNWEQATVEAAKVFRMPWRLVASKCEEIGRSVYVRNVCPKCGRLFNYSGVLCTLCREGERSYRELTAKAALEAHRKETKRFYREERNKKEKEGTA